MKVLTTFLFVLLAMLLAAPAFAEDDMSLGALFAEPGVKLVVVEFYADWCKPCKEAAPKWNKLHLQYAKQGLRFVVISLSEKGLCSNPGWSPDKTICDLDGTLQKTWKVEQLPMAFLLSWQGKKLVDHGHFQQVQASIIEFFKTTPRIALAPLTDSNDKEIEDPNGLRERVRGILAKQAKFDIVATGSEMEAIRKLRAETYNAAKDEEQHCELGRELSANTEIKLKLFGAGSNKRLSLQAYSIERGCLVANGEARITSRGVDKAVGLAVEELIYDLMGRKSELKALDRDKELKQEGIMVMPLDTKQGVDEKFVDSVSGLITADVERFSGLKVISNADIRAALQSQETLSRCTGGAESSECLLAWRKSLGVSQVVSGDLARIGEYWVINLRLINSRDAEVLGRVGQKIKGDQSALLEALPGMVAELFGTRVPEEAQAEGSVAFVGKPGVLDVSTVPSGAELWMQGKMIGKTPIKQQSPAGVYSIEVRLEGHKSVQQEIEIKAGKSTKKVFDLERVYAMSPSKKGGHAVFWTGLGFATFGGIATWRASESANAAKLGNKASNKVWSGLAVTGYTLGGAGIFVGIILLATAPSDKEWWEKHQVGASPTVDGKGTVVSFGGNW